MLMMVTRNWWVMALRGAVAILFGILALVWPGAALATLVLFFGAFAFADGILASWAAFNMRRQNRMWGPLLLEGITGVVLGLLVFLWPAMTAVVLILFVAAWAFVTGVFEIAAAISLRKEIEGEWALGLSGVLSIGLGVLLALWPGAGLLALIVVIGVYAIVFGVVMVALAFRLRGLHQSSAA